MDSGTGQRQGGTVDPVLYTRTFLLMERGEREWAVRNARAEMGWDQAEAEAFVDRVWRSHEEAIPPELLDAPARRPWAAIAAAGVAAARVLTFGFFSR